MGRILYASNHRNRLTIRRGDRSASISSSNFSLRSAQRSAIEFNVAEMNRIYFPNAHGELNAVRR